jgi:succinate dehydrogenase flavin-adding protein (antitoxin of CptAB toxin-antitoxin module)
LNLDSQKKKNGSNVYYVSSIKVDADASIKFSKEDEITLGKFQTIINEENNDVLDLYKNAQKSKLKNEDIIDAKMVEDIDPAIALAQ